MKPLKILIVDDSATMRKMVRRVVELSEVAIADIYEAANGREALDVIDSRPVDALFTDINMPVMTGIELLKQLSTREAGNKPALRVVISTDGSDARLDVGDEAADEDDLAVARPQLGPTAEPPDAALLDGLPHRHEDDVAEAGAQPTHGDERPEAVPLQPQLQVEGCAFD